MNKYVAAAAAAAIACAGPAADGPHGWVYPTNPDASEARVTPLHTLEPGSATLDSDQIRVRTCIEPSCEAVEARATADADGQFLWEPAPEGDADPAAEVNAFAHLHEWASHLAELGLSTPGFDAHVDYAPDVDGDGDADPVRTFVRRDGPRPALLLGRWFGRRTAYDADILRVGLTRLALGEPPSPTLAATGLDMTAPVVHIAVADYLVASASGDPALGEYLAVASNQAALNALGGPERWPDDATGEPFRDAVIWANALWRWRGLLGQARADALAVALGVARPATTESARQVLITADSGATETIDEVLATLGLGDAPVQAFAERGTIAVWLPAITTPAVATDGTPLPDGPRPAALQLAIDVPAGTERLLVTAVPVQGQPIGPVRVYARAGAPVRFDAAAPPGGDPVALLDGRGTVENPVPPDPPMTRIYLGVEHLGERSGFLWLGATID